MPKYYDYNGRDTVESTKSIDLAFLNKRKVLKGHFNQNIKWSINENPTGNIDLEINTIDENPYIRLNYKVKKSYETEWRPINYKTNLISVPCYFGGERWFYECGLSKDGKYCGRRSRILYQIDDYFGCRKCANLSYESCNKSTQNKKSLYRLLNYEFASEEYYTKNVKRMYYKGRPTKKYKRYLKLQKKGFPLNNVDN
jgi:hypothetical protein